MYKVKETESALEVRSKTAMGFVWTGLFLVVFLVSAYNGFEYFSVKTERTLQAVTGVSAVQSNKKKKSKSKKENKVSTEIYYYITYFSFKEGFQEDSTLLSQIIRMDRGYSSSTNEVSFIFHYNPTFITSQQKRYPLRRISDVTFTQKEVVSEKFNDFLLNGNTLAPLSIWDWYMGYWGIAAGVSFLGLLFLSVSGRYQIAFFDKEKYTFSIKNYGLLGFVKEEGNWKNIKKIIYQDKKTAHKKGIFFVVKLNTVAQSKKYKTKKVYFTHHTDEISKEVVQRIADLIRPIAKPKSEKNQPRVEGNI